MVNIGFRLALVNYSLRRKISTTSYEQRICGSGFGKALTHTSLRGTSHMRECYFMPYKHTQIGYLMLVVTICVLALFAWAQITSRAEPPSPDSGANFLVTSIMALIIFVLASFWSLQVIIDEQYLRVKFGYGIYKKKFLLSDIISAKAVKNRWYYGWGIRGWLWPKMWVYNVSGLNAVEIKLKNGKTYRIGTDEPKKLEQEIVQLIK